MSQEELEQTVKGYQLAAVEDRLDMFEKNIMSSIDRLTTTVTANPSVSPATLESTRQAVQSEFKQLLKQEIEKIHLEYSPVKKQIQWVWRTAGGQILGLAIQAVFMFFIFRNNQ